MRILMIDLMAKKKCDGNVGARAVLEELQNYSFVPTEKGKGWQ